MEKKNKKKKPTKNKTETHILLTEIQQEHSYDIMSNFRVTFVLAKSFMASTRIKKKKKWMFLARFKLWNI